MSDSQKDNTIPTLKDNDGEFHLVFKDILKNEHHSYLVLKTEKLASALYMVTGFIPTEDPLRVRLRTCALELVSVSADPEQGSGTRYHEGFASRCLEIGTALKLAERAGMVSGMNARILCDEYAELASFVREHRDRVFGSAALEPAGGTLFPKPKGAARVRPLAAAPTAPRIGQITRRPLESKRHSNRREAILRLLDKKDKISIKDASAAINGCSEKTIQRELMGLVEEGVLLKEGSRRWSTYRKAV